MRNDRRNKERLGKGDDENKAQSKKTFDKKKYRLQKYSNKYKGRYMRHILYRLTLLFILYICLFACSQSMGRKKEKSYATWTLQRLKKRSAKF